MESSSSSVGVVGDIWKARKGRDTSVGVLSCPTSAVAMVVSAAEI